MMRPLSTTSGRLASASWINYFTIVVSTNIILERRQRERERERERETGICFSHHELFVAADVRHLLRTYPENRDMMKAASFRRVKIVYPQQQNKKTTTLSAREIPLGSGKVRTLLFDFRCLGLGLLGFYGWVGVYEEECCTRSKVNASILL